MDNKERSNKEIWGFWGVIIAALITGVVALIVAYKPPLPFLTPIQTQTVVFTAPATLSSTEIPTITETPNWAISFEYQFPSNPWSVGMHEYTIENSCPNVDIDGTGTHSASHTQTFEVSESAAVLPGNAYLRISGLTDKPLDAQLLENIKPLQTTIAVWTLIGMTQAQAELAVTDCTVTVSWDGGTAKQLQPGLPFQR